MQEEVPVAAQHQAVAKAGETDGLVAQIVRFPTARGHSAEIEQSVGDFAVRSGLEPRIERAQCEYQAVTPVL